MSADLATTNLLLAVLAVVGVIEALMFIAVGDDERRNRAS